MRPVGILISLATALAVTSVHAGEFVISSIHPFDPPTVQAVDSMGRQIELRTGGKHTIRRAVLSVDMDSESFLIASLRNGSLDMGRVNIESLNDIVSATIVPSLPFLFKSRQQLRDVLDGPVGAEILAAMEPAGLVGLCFYDVGARSLYAKRPIRNIADIKGMTVRIQPSTMSAAMMHAVGAKVSTISHDRVPVSLEHGIIDAAESSWTSYISSGDNQMARFFSPTEHTMVPEMLVFSKNVWDKLTKEEQTIIRVAAKESVALMRKAWDEREGSARAAVEQSGSIWVDDVDRKSFSDAMFPVRARFLIEPKLQDMVNRILATH